MKFIRDQIEFFFLAWVPFWIIIFLVMLMSFLFIAGKFDKADEEPVVDVSDRVDLVEKYYADDDREIVYIRKNEVSTRPYHFTIDFLGGEKEYVRLFLDGEEIKVENVEVEG